MGRNRKLLTFILLTVVLAGLVFLCGHTTLLNWAGGAFHGEGTATYYRIAAADDGTLWAMGRRGDDYVLSGGTISGGKWSGTLNTEKLPERFLVEDLYALNEDEALLSLYRVNDDGDVDALQLYEIRSRGRSTDPLLSIECLGTGATEQRASAHFSAFSLYNGTVKFLLWQGGNATVYGWGGTGTTVTASGAFQCPDWHDALVAFDGTILVGQDEGMLSVYDTYGNRQFDLEINGTIARFFDGVDSFYYLDTTSNTVKEISQTNEEYYLIQKTPVDAAKPLAVQPGGSVLWLDGNTLYRYDGAPVEVEGALYGSTWQNWIWLVLTAVAVLGAAGGLTLLLCGKRQISLLIRGGLVLVMLLAMAIGVMQVYVLPRVREMAKEQAKQSTMAAVGLAVKLMPDTLYTEDTQTTTVVKKTDTAQTSSNIPTMQNPSLTGATTPAAETTATASKTTGTNLASGTNTNTVAATATATDTASAAKEKTTTATATTASTGALSNLFGSTAQSGTASKTAETKEKAAPGTSGTDRVSDALVDSGLYNAETTLYRYSTKGYEVLESTSPKLEKGVTLAGSGLLLQVDAQGTVAEIRDTLNGPVCGAVAASDNYLVETTVNLSNMLEKAEDSLRVLRNFLLGTMLVVIAAMLLLLLYIWSGIYRLTEGVRVISSGQYDVEMVNPSGDEIENLANVLNGMAATLKENRDKSHDVDENYMRFIPRETIELLGVARLEDVTQETVANHHMVVMTVKFRLPEEDIPTAQLYSDINTVIQRTTFMAVAYTGSSFDFTHNGFNVVFPMDHAEDAVRAAVAIQGAVTAVNKERENRRRDPVDMRIALDCGLVQMGIIGDELHMVPTAISLCMEKNAQILRWCSVLDAKILLSENMLGNQGTLGCRYVGVMRHGGEAVKLYEVYESDSYLLGRGKKETQAEFDSAVACFYERDFAGAKRQLLHLARTGSGQDGALRYYLTLADRYENGAPEELWLKEEDDRNEYNRAENDPTEIG